MDDLERDGLRDRLVAAVLGLKSGANVPLS